MNRVLRTITAIPALFLLLLGARWLFDPAGAAQALGMPLMEGMGLSTQIGDLGAYFTGGAIMVALGVITLNKTWLQAAALLIALTAAFRTLAYAVYGAELATTAITVEVVITALLIFSASRINPVGTSDNGE